MTFEELCIINKKINQIIFKSFELLINESKKKKKTIIKENLNSICLTFLFRVILGQYQC